MNRKVWWVRHAPTHAHTMVGWTDLAADLSDTSVLNGLSSLFPDDSVIVSSDLQRARDTAHAIAGERVRAPDDPALREMHFGAWENLTFKEAEARDRDLLFNFWDQPGRIAPPGGESWDAFAQRVTEGVDALFARTSGDLVVVAHMGTILTQYQRALSLTARETFAQKIDNLSVTEILYEVGQAPVLISVNQRL